MAEIGETELDIRALSRTLWRRGWIVVLLAILAAGATYWALGHVAPLYTADARILIESRESPLTRPRDQSSAPTNEFDESAIQSQVEVLRSREIADAVVDKLDLTSRPELDPARNPSFVRGLMIMAGIAKPPTDSSVRQRVMESYFEHLSVYPVQKSRVIGVDFSAPDADLAAEVANAVSESFVALQQDAKRQSAVAATAWLQQEIERLRKRVAEAEQAVADYRKAHSLFDVDQTGNNDNANLSTQQLSDINAELARARAARAEAEARADQVESVLQQGGDVDTSPEVLSSPLIQRLRERQVALQAQIADLSTTLLPGHPRLKALQGQIANLDAQIHREVEKVLASLKTAARVAAAREKSLQASLDESKTDVSRTNEQEIDLRALEREAAAQRELLESFLGRYREAAARTDSNYLPADARIISRAVPPREPSFPKKTLMSVAAAIAVFLIGLAVLMLREFTSGRAFRPIGGAMTLLPPAVPAKPAEPKPAPVVESAPPPVPAAPKEGPAPEADANSAPDASEPKVVVTEAPKAEDADDARASDNDAANDGAVEATLAATAALEAAEALDAAEAKDDAEPEAGSDTEAADDDAEQPTADEPKLETETAAEDQPDAPAVAADEAEVAAAAALAGTEGAEPAPAEDEPDAEARAGTAELAEILASSSVRVALFAGAEGGEGPGEIAYSTARLAAEKKLRCILIDVGKAPSEALGHDRPGLRDLLAGDASFGEVIRRDDDAGVHVIPLGSVDKTPPMQRMQLVIGALTHTYDKVVIVADNLDDWPEEHVHPDIAAIVCGPDATELMRTAVYDTAMARGAQSAIIVRYSGESDMGDSDSEAAA